MEWKPQTIKDFKSLKNYAEKVQLALHNLHHKPINIKIIMIFGMQNTPVHIKCHNRGWPSQAGTGRIFLKVRNSQPTEMNGDSNGLGIRRFGFLVTWEVDSGGHWIKVYTRISTLSLYAVIISVSIRW